MLLGVLGDVACSGSGSKCSSGAVQPCACGAKRPQGIQTCQKNGTFSACSCSSGAAGAGGGKGGASGTAGEASGGATGAAGDPSGAGSGGAAGDGSGGSSSAGAAGGAGGASAGAAGAAAGAGGASAGSGGAGGGAGGASAGAGGTTAGAGGGGAGGTSCVPPAAATDYSCTSMARFTAATQVVDGIGDEFCNVPPVHYTAANAPYREGHSGGSAPPLTAPPETVTFRAAWSVDAFHLHAHVDDPSIYESNDNTTLYNGDEIEIFVAGGPNFSVTYPAGTDSNSIEIGVVPPAGLVGARGVVYLGQNRQTLDSQYFAARLVPGGYEVEVKLPWQGTAKPTQAGDTMGFYFGLSTQDTAGVGREEYASLPVTTFAGASSCPIAPPLPWCDDRAWCHPTLK